MFVADLFEAPASHLKKLVIMPGGFHPFHIGHMALYNSAVRAFPGADVYIAATNKTTDRPIPFDVKQQLATIAGVPEGHFVQVKSPFQAKEITQHYDPNTTALIFVRSEKDRNEPPQAGGVKKDGSASYLQPISKHLKPMSQHGYMAYLPTVEFAGGITSASEIRAAWAKANPAGRAKIAQTLYPADPKRALQLLSVLGEEASGVIATKSQARDPRYSMSLTKDVRPGAINKNLRAFDLAEVDLSSTIADVSMYLIKKYRDDIDYYRDLIADPSINPEIKPHYKKKIADLQQKILDIPKR
jgi:hypothetical protein